MGLDHDKLQQLLLNILHEVTASSAGFSGSRGPSGPKTAGGKRSKHCNFAVQFIKESGFACLAWPEFCRQAVGCEQLKVALADARLCRLMQVAVDEPDTVGTPAAGQANSSSMQQQPVATSSTTSYSSVATGGSSSSGLDDDCTGCVVIVSSNHRDPALAASELICQEYLGRGAFGVVYTAAAHNSSCQLDLVIKVCLSADGDQYEKMADDEVQTMALLRGQEGIAHLYGVGFLQPDSCSKSLQKRMQQQGPVICFIMQRYKCSLQQELRGKGKQLPGKAVVLLVGLLKPIAYMHSGKAGHKAVHR